LIIAAGVTTKILLTGTPVTPQAPNPPTKSQDGSPPADASTEPKATLATIQTLRKEAVDACRRAMEDFPQSVGPILLMGDCHHQFGNGAEAVKWWRKVLDRNPEHSGACYLIAVIATKNGDYEKAAELFRKTLQISPRMRGVPLQLAKVLVELGKSREATEILREELRVNPRDAAAIHHILGQAHLQLKQYDKAVASYAKAIEVAPNDPAACYGLSVAHARLGRTEEAGRYREKFRKIRKDLNESVRNKRLTFDDLNRTRKIAATLHFRIGNIIYLRNKRLDEAEQRFKRAAELNPKDQLCLRQLAKLYMRRKRFSEAADICVQLTKLAPTNAAYHLNAGQVLGKLRRFSEAEEALARAAKLAPGNTVVRRIREQMRTLAVRQ